MSKIIPFHPHRPGQGADPGGRGSGSAPGFAATGSSFFDLRSSIPRGYNGPSVSTQAETILQEGRPFLVGEWLVEPTLNRLTRGGDSVQLESKAIDVLLCLVAHAGQVVSKDTLFDTVWQTEFVSDSTLTSRIGELRNALGDDAQSPRYIETIRKRGYRLIAEVRAVTTPAETPLAIPEAPPSPEDDSRSRRPVSLSDR
jgi:DNA-binding winged helix-turn-helix (wHTH) protein